MVLRKTRTYLHFLFYVLLLNGQIKGNTGSMMLLLYGIELKVLIYLQSGGTPETRNGLLEVQKAFREAGLNFPKQV